MARTITHSLDVDGLQVVARIYGEGEPTFVLIHGLGMSSYFFRPLAERLARHGRVVCLNLPGFGPAREPDRALRIGQFATVARAAVKRLGVGPAVWVGHSLGTQIVVEVAVQDPGIATRVVLLAPVVNTQERRIGQVILRFLQSSIHETLPAAFAAARAYLKAGVRYVMEIVPGLLRYPMLERVQSLPCPTLFVVGEHDALTPEYWRERLVAAAPEGQSHIIFGASHALVHTHADEATAVIAGSQVPSWRPRVRDIAREFTRVIPRRHPRGTTAENVSHPTVLLLPGIFEGPKFLTPLATYLRQTGHEVITVPKLGWNIRSLDESVTLALDAAGHRTSVVIVAHSKGGLIGKKLMLHPTGSRIVAGMVAIATPFNGTLLAPRLQGLRITKASPLGVIHPDHPDIQMLERAQEVNRRIVHLMPTRDPLVPLIPELPGATTIVLDQIGHFAPLEDRKAWELVAHYVSQWHGITS